LLGLALVVAVDRDEGEGDLEVLAHVGQDIVVGDNGDDFSAEVADLLAEQEVVEAMGGLGREHGHARNVVGEGQLPLEVETLRELGDLGPDVARVRCESRQIPHQAHEELAAVEFRMLVRVQDVSTVGEHEAGESGHEPRAVATVHEKGCGTAWSGAMHSTPKPPQILWMLRERKKDTGTVVAWQGNPAILAHSPQWAWSVLQHRLPK
jgi:hypothetical protein